MEMHRCCRQFKNQQRHMLYAVGCTCMCLCCDGDGRCCRQCENQQRHMLYAVGCTCMRLCCHGDGRCCRQCENQQRHMLYAVGCTCMDMCCHGDGGCCRQFENQQRQQQMEMIDRILTEERRLKKRRKRQPQLWGDPKWEKSLVRRWSHSHCQCPLCQRCSVFVFKTKMEKEDASQILHEYA